MTVRLKEAIERVQELPGSEQDKFADLLFDALEANTDKKELPFWVRASPEERAQRIRTWAAGFTGGVGIPDEALRRVNMYD